MVTKHFDIEKYWQFYSRITRSLSIVSLIIMIIIIVDVFPYFGISDFSAILIGRAARMAGCFAFPLYFISRLILSSFVILPDKNKFTLGVSLIAFLLSLVFQI